MERGEEVMYRNSGDRSLVKRRTLVEGGGRTPMFFVLWILRDI
jgi:hypothetical protein